MDWKKSRHYFKFMTEDWLSLKKKPLIMVIILLLLPLIYAIVYTTGGVKYVYAHTMYIPILMAGIFYGASFGTAIALIAALLLGPLMPMDVFTDEIQHTMNWIYRLIIFVIAGYTIGYASNKLRREAKHIRELMSMNQETNVPNTNYLRERIKELSYNSYSVITVLLNNHHNIIDVLGISIYHELINSIYTDLVEGLPQDTVIVQSDSNKLWIVIPNDNLEENIKKIIDMLNRSRQIREIPLYLDFSIGGSISFDLTSAKESKDFENSDISARYAQVNNLVYAIGDLENSQSRSEYDLLATFSKAIDDHDTYLVYQPKIDLKTMKPYGLEALMRWEHPVRGNIPPDVFIPLVEETKLIHVLTDWVLKKTLVKCKELMNLGFEVPISLNISGKNLYDSEFYNRCIEMIDRYEVPYELIEFELTESTLMRNPQESKVILQRFVDKGIKISLDDYGKGYSSLAYLTQFPLDFIKIDRYFMGNINRDSSMLSIIKSTILLSKSLGYKVVVEGVETKESVELLQSLDCEYAQGYYFSKPIATNKINKWYKDHK